MVTASTFGLVGVLGAALSLVGHLEDRALLGRQDPVLPQAKELLDRRKEIKKELADNATKLKSTRDLRERSKDNVASLVAALRVRIDLLKKKLNAGPPPEALETAIRAAEDDIHKHQTSQKKSDDALLLVESMLLKRAAKLSDELRLLEERIDKQNN